MDEMTIPDIDLATVAKTVAETERRRVVVREKLDHEQSVVEARRQADAVEAQLASVGATTRSAVSAAIDIQNRIDTARGALDVASARKRETDETCEALGAITDALRSKTAETAGAVNEID